MKTLSTTLIFQYWDTLRGERSAPERGEIDPGAVSAALADAFICENGADGLVFRLAGTRMCMLFGEELKGASLTGLWRDAAMRVELQRMADAVMDDCAGAVAGVSAQTANGRKIDLELLILPLRHAGRTHSRVLGALSIIHPADVIPSDPVIDGTFRSMRIIWPSGLPRVRMPQRTARPQFTVISGGRT